MVRINNKNSKILYQWDQNNTTIADYCMKIEIRWELYLDFIINVYKKGLQDSNKTPYNHYPLNYAFKIYLKWELEQMISHHIFEITFIFKN